jgi:hypothetical protein
MSIKASLVRTAIKWTPKFLIVWVANKKLRGIARLSDFSLDIDARKVYVKTWLAGEAEAIEVLVEDFAVVGDQGSYELIVSSARSNRPWLNNALALVTKKPWKIPPIPQLAPHMGLVTELFGARKS